MSRHLSVFALLEDQRVRGSQIIRLQRPHEGLLHTKIKESEYLIRRAAADTDREHASHTKIYLSLHCYPTTKALGLDMQPKEKKRKRGTNNYTETEKSLLLFHLQQLPHCYLVQRLLASNHQRKQRT